MVFIVSWQQIYGVNTSFWGLVDYRNDNSCFALINVSQFLRILI